MHVWHNKVGCCLAVIAGLSSAAVAAPDADSYIRRGLIAQWDGIDNLGTGTHVADTNVWVDRTGNSTAFTASYLSFADGNCAYLQGTRITSTCSKLPSVYAESTIEAHAFSPRYTRHGAVDVLLSTGQGGALFWQGGGTQLRLHIRRDCNEGLFCWSHRRGIYICSRAKS